MLGLGRLGDPTHTPEPSPWIAPPGGCGASTPRWLRSERPSRWLRSERSERLETTNEIWTWWLLFAVLTVLFPCAAYWVRVASLDR